MKTKVFAHRGASKYAPENTMPAFQLAYEMKAEGIETDVQLTKDGVPILIHDETLERTTNGAGFVKDFNFQELKRLDAGRYFSQQFTKTRLISLDEFLEWAREKHLYLNLELKNNKINYKGLEEKVLQMIHDYKVEHRTIISSFNADSVKRLRKLNPDIDIAYLRSKKHAALPRFSKSLGASSMHIKYTLLNPQLVNSAKAYELPVRIYTVNHRKNIMQGFRYNCDAIITDVPDKALQLRNRFK